MSFFSIGLSFLSSGLPTALQAVWKRQKKAIVQISKFAIFCDTTKHDIQNALLSSVSDFEDAVIVSSAKREDMDFIITRNKKDFANSVVKAITPIEFLESS